MNSFAFEITKNFVLIFQTSFPDFRHEFKNSIKCNEGIGITVDLNEGMKLVSDPDQIKQVLWNILLNAAEAMPKGGLINIYAGIEQINPDIFMPGKDMVRIVIRDSGEGFSDDSLSSIFTPFFTTKDGGSGLGLATVNRIIEGLKGRASGRNHPDGGAEITILLPKEP